MAKREKRSRKKRLIKKKVSLFERAKEHRLKAEKEPGRKDTTPKYWISEAERFEEQARDVEKIIDKLKKLDKKENKDKKRV